MRLLLGACVSAVILCCAQGTSIFNRNGGLLRAFKGTNPENTDRDQEVISVAGDASQIAVVAGTDVGIPTGFFKVYGESIDHIVCFQTGFCEAAATAPDPLWAIDSPPTESPVTTGMAGDHTNVLFAPYVVTHDDASYSYQMAYRLLNYTQTYDQVDIEDLLGRKYDLIPEDKNLITPAILTNYQGVVVTWSISNLAGTETSKFQFVLLSDGTNDYVFYIYGAMGLTGVTGVRGFVTGGAGPGAGGTGPGVGGRICSRYDTATPTATDLAPLEAHLPLDSNYKCGKPGNYFFDASSTNNADFCEFTATECSDNYALATPKKGCNVTATPMDSCLVSSFCQLDPTDTNLIKLTVYVDWWDRTASDAGSPTYMQALTYSKWQADVTMAAEQEQVFVAKTAAPNAGDPCGKTLTMNQEKIEFTIDKTAAEVDRCGIHVEAGPPEVIYFAFKIFEYTFDGATAGFGPNAMIDKWGDWIITGSCAPGDLLFSVSVSVPFNGPSTPTALPTRPRAITMEIVDDIDDSTAVVLSNLEMGQYYYIRICYDRGTPFNEQADPFAIHTVSCSVSNKADFVATDPLTEATVEFIEQVAASGDSCPIANGATTGPMYMNSDFKVRSSPTTYDPTDAGFPTTPWCIYTDKIRAARWNKFQTLALVRKLWFKCSIGFCTKFDFTSTPSEGQRCIDNCAGVKRRKREVSNDTTSYPREVVYTSVTIEDPEETQEEFCAPDSSDFTIAMATVITLIALLCVAVVAAILVFVKLLRAGKRSEKEKRFK